MSAAEALKAARALGIEFEIDGTDLFLYADAPPPARLVEMLSDHKGEIVALIRPGDDGWSHEDWHDFFDERAAIAEFEGGLPLSQAEASAFDCCVIEWLHRYVASSPPARCVACSDAYRRHDLLLPHGIEAPGHAWLHDLCWSACYAGRRAEAVNAIWAMGIEAPRKLPSDFGKNRAR